MRRMNCRRCGSIIMWDGVTAIVRCNACGTQYRIHPGGADPSSQQNKEGVHPIPTTQGQYAGTPLVKSFIPGGWTTATNAPECEMNVLVPLTPQVEYAAPGGDAFITYTGIRAYNHLDPNPRNAQMQGRIAMPDRMIGLAYRDAGTICDGLIQGNPNITDVRLLSAMDKPDQWAENTIRKAVAGYAKAGTLNPGGNWAKRYYTAADKSGRTWHKLIEVTVIYAYLPVSPQEQQLYQMAMQMRMRIMLPPPQPKLRWTVDYVVETSALEGAFPSAMKYHEQIRNSFEPLPVFTRESNSLRELMKLQSIQDSNTINNAMAQMNRDRMASWDRRRNIIQGASDYGTQVMREMRENTERTNQRVNNLRSEAIRGVNTYYTHNTGYHEPHVVEASTRWDHVYQNQRYNDVYAASTGDAPLEFGVDFEELERTDGEY